MDSDQVAVYDFRKLPLQRAKRSSRRHALSPFTLVIDSPGVACGEDLFSSDSMEEPVQLPVTARVDPHSCELSTRARNGGGTALGCKSIAVAEVSHVAGMPDKTSRCDDADSSKLNQLRSQRLHERDQQPLDASDVSIEALDRLDGDQDFVDIGIRGMPLPLHRDRRCAKAGKIRTLGAISVNRQGDHGGRSLESIDFYGALPNESIALIVAQAQGQLRLRLVVSGKPLLFSAQGLRNRLRVNRIRLSAACGVLSIPLGHMPRHLVDLSVPSNQKIGKPSTVPAGTFKTPNDVPIKILGGTEARCETLLIIGDRQALEFATHRVNERNRVSGLMAIDASENAHLGSLSESEQHDHQTANFYRASIASVFPAKEMVGLRLAGEFSLSQRDGCGRASQASLASIIAIKAEEAARTVVEVDPRYSSQECARCGQIAAESRRGRRYACVSCGFRVHADVNAALVIRRRAELRPAARGASVEDLNDPRSAPDAGAEPARNDQEVAA